LLGFCREGGGGAETILWQEGSKPREGGKGNEILLPRQLDKALPVQEGVEVASVHEVMKLL